MSARHTWVSVRNIWASVVNAPVPAPVMEQQHFLEPDIPCAEAGPGPKGVRWQRSTQCYLNFNQMHFETPSKSISKRGQLLAINAHTMAPRMGQRFQEWG